MRQINCSCCRLHDAFHLAIENQSVWSKMKAKKKHVTLTLQKKIEILDRFQKGESVRKVAEYFNISKSTIFSIKKNEKKIRFVLNTFDGTGNIYFVFSRREAISFFF